MQITKSRLVVNCEYNFNFNMWASKRTFKFLMF